MKKKVIVKSPTTGTTVYEINTKIRQSQSTQELKEILKAATHVGASFDITFSATAAYERKAASLFTDEELSALYDELTENPEAGDLIQGAGGCRKIRVANKGRGKSGSARVIYFIRSGTNIWLMAAYEKSDMSNISDKVKQSLAKMAATLPEV